MRWDVLQFDTQIAAVVKTLGWVGIAGTCAWLLWRAWQDLHRRGEQRVSVPATREV